MRCFVAFFKFAGVINSTPEMMYLLNCIETYPIFLIPIIRLNEPIILETLKDALKCPRKKKSNERKSKKISNEKEKKKNFTEDSLFSFLNSQLNVEYVYLILRGICQIMADEKIKAEKQNLYD